MLRVVLGSYERLLYGLDVTEQDNGTGGYNVNQTFTYPAHIASIRAIAVSHNAKLLATGSTDEHVKLYSLHRNKESGTLFHHTGTITDLAFHETGYLFTASEDTNIAIVRTSDWEVLKVLKGHTTAIQSISIHPSGKLLLSVSIDGYLRTWDTAKASCAYTLKMPIARPVKVCWSKCGLFYAVLFEAGVLCFAVATGKEVLRNTALGRLCCMDFVENEGKPVLIVSGDSKKVSIFSPSSTEISGNLITTISLTSNHSVRIKDLSIAQLGTRQILVTCSSDGAIFGWDLGKGVKDADFGAPLFNFDAKVRLTCCKVAYQAPGKETKKNEDKMERDNDEDDEDDDDDDDGGQVVVAVGKEVEKPKSKRQQKKEPRVLVSYENDDSKNLSEPLLTQGPTPVVGSKTDGRSKILSKMNSNFQSTLFPQRQRNSMQINDSKATFTLQTRPSRLVRVKTPPPTSLLPKNQPYPYSSSHPLLKPHGFSQGEVLPPLPYPLNNNKSLEFSTSQKSNTNSFGNGKKKHSQTVVNMSTGTLSTPPSYQPQSTSKKPKIRVEQQQQQQYHQQHQQKYKGKTKAHQPATSKILLTGKSVKKNLYLQDAEKIASKVPKAATGKRKVIGNFDADNPGIYSTHDNGSKNLIPKKLEERMPSILTLQEQEPEEYDFTKGDSDIDDVRNELDEAEGEEEEDSEFEDDEEEQEISDFDSLGECEDEEDGSMGGETLDDDEETKTGCSRSASSYGSDDTSSGLKNWKTTPTQANHNLTQRNAIKTKNFSSSAQKYGIAVMIDDDTENQFSANGETVVKSGHKIKSAIVPSLFDDGEAVLYFPREGESVMQIPSELKAAMKWKICKFTPRVVRTCLRKAGFKLVKGGKKWIGYWGKHYAAEKFRTIEPWQKVNHFPMSFEIGRKDKMYLNVSRMRERVRDELDFLPATYFLPNQRRRLKLAFGTHPCWIIKPPASARGIGIRVVNRWKDIPQRKDIIVSKYVQNPYLIDKKKFDIRLYVVVTSFDPLRIYLFKEGIVRFAGEKSLALLDKYFSRQGINFAPVMERIKHIIVSTVISTHAANSSGTRMYTTNTSSCYELFGFDVLLDAHLKPWIMEVNISPSLKASCDIDLAIKSRLSIDLFNLVGIKVKDLDESQKSHKKRKAQKPFLSSSERAKLRQFASSNGDLNLLVDLTNNDLKILKESEDENRRCGNFERIFPSLNSASYFKLFAAQPYNDNLLLQWIKQADIDWPKAYSLLRKLPNASNSYAYAPQSPASSSLSKTATTRRSSAAVQRQTSKDTHTATANIKITVPTVTPIKHTENKSTQEGQTDQNSIWNAKSSCEIKQAISSQQQQTQPLTQKSNARQIQSHAREFGSYTSSHSDVTAAAGLNKYPERQQIDVKKAILTASSAGIAPRVNPTYTLKPRKIFVRKPEDGLGIFGNGNSSELLLQSQLQPPPQPSQQPAPPPSVVINELASIVKEMQQIQCQRQMQQQTRRAAIPSSCGLNKEYPSTSAYTAAMAIAHVTAKFRALEMNEQDRKFQHDLPTWNNILKDIG